MQNQINVNLEELSLPFAVGTPTYTDVKVVSGKLHVGYLVLDPNAYAKNPFELSQQMGVFYNMLVPNDYGDQANEALAQDEDGRPDVTHLFVDGNMKTMQVKPEFEPIFFEEWLEQASRCSEFEGWVTTLEHSGVSRGDYNTTEKYLRDKAKEVWSLDNQDFKKFYSYMLTCDKVWATLRKSRLVGNKDVVRLECSLGAVPTWSILGEEQAAHGELVKTNAGVWVPNEGALKLINERANVYAFGDIAKVAISFSEDLYLLYYDTSVPNVGPFDQFGSYEEAYAALKAVASSLANTDRGNAIIARNTSKSRERAAKWIVRGALEHFNAWKQGHCYGAINAVYTNTGATDCPKWVLEASKQSWHLMGRNRAIAKVSLMLDSLLLVYS